MDRLFKSYGEVKAGDAGTISGYFSTYDRIPDSYGDVIAPGAFTDTLKARKESGHPFPLCWNHDLDQIIGTVDNIEDTEKGPLMTASFFDTPLAQEKRALVLSGCVYQFSFAYEVKKAAQVELEDGTKANELRELELFEVSIVPIPANPRAEVTEIKSGRRNSKADAEKLEQAITLIRDVLGQLDDTEPEPEESETEEEASKANEAAVPEEPEVFNSRKDALLERIKNMEVDKNEP